VQNSYFLLKQLVPELKEHLLGASIEDCFSQHRDELVLQFAKSATQEFTVIAHLNPQFTCLAFPQEYQKAKKNTATIFSRLYHLKVIDIKNYAYERAFSIEFENNYSMLFKLFGQQSNVVIYENGSAKDLFRNNLKKDYALDLNTLSRQIDKNKAVFMSNFPNLEFIFPYLEKSVRIILEKEIVGLSAEKAYEKVSSFISELEHPKAFYIVEKNDQVRFTLIQEGQTLAEYKSPMEALSYFFRIRLKTDSFTARRRGLLKEFKRNVTKTTSYLLKAKHKKEELGNKSSHRDIADLIMANLHLIETDTASIELPDFYTNESITIKLNPRITAQKNAEKYYHKAKNVGTEIRKLAETIAVKEQLLIALDKDLLTIQNATEIADLQAFIKTAKKEKSVKKIPFKQFDIDGFTVLVGNNARQNDLLTLKFAKKEDLFFHAKDVTGSHVILKQVSGRSIPKTTLEKTAALAAYYSKRKTDTLCPVGYTAKKYVRKPKGSPPGLVLVEREKVLLVKPELPN
jgi:predicted ribosome quality control (RQC) complex YloA/Tae2 family protein